MRVRVTVCGVLELAFIFLFLCEQHCVLEAYQVTLISRVFFELEKSLDTSTCEDMGVAA